MLRWLGILGPHANQIPDQQVVGSLDLPSHNAAMVRKLDLPFPLLSDPRGDFIKSLGLWNEKEGLS